VIDGIALSDSLIAPRTADHGRRYAVMNKCFAIGPIVIRLGVDQSWQNPFAGGIDHARAVGDIDLPYSANRGDSVTFNNNDGICDRCAAIAVDECATLDNQCLLPLGRHGRRRTPKEQRGTGRHQTAKVRFFHFVSPIFLLQAIRNALASQLRQIRYV
jgi:hypothetical protein